MDWTILDALKIGDPDERGEIEQLIEGNPTLNNLSRLDQAVFSYMIHRMRHSSLGYVVFSNLDEVDLPEIIGERCVPGAVATFAALGPDWPGFVDSVVGAVRFEELNLAYAIALDFHWRGSRWGWALIRSHPCTAEHIERFCRTRREILEDLSDAAEPDANKSLLFQAEYNRVTIYSRTAREIRRQAPELADRLLNKGDEVLMFFRSRSPAYLIERLPKDLANELITNLRFRDAIIAGPAELQVEVRTVATTKGDQTAIILAVKAAKVGLSDILEAIKEIEPEFILRYQKAFTHPARIAHYRIEILDHQSHALSEKDTLHLKAHLAGLLERDMDRRPPLPGSEVVIRLVCPLLAQEEAELGSPQGYFFPFSDVHVKFILVYTDVEKDAGASPGEATEKDLERNYIYEITTAINQVEGFRCSYPDYVTTLRTPLEGGGAKKQKVGIIDIKYDPAKVLEPGQEFHVDEVLVLLEGILKRIPRLGDDIRIFDQGMRQIRKIRLGPILQRTSAAGIPARFVTAIFPRQGDRHVTSEPYTDDMLIWEITSSWEAWRVLPSETLKAVTGSRANERKPDMSLFVAAVVGPYRWDQKVPLVASVPRPAECTICRMDTEERGSFLLFRWCVPTSEVEALGLAVKVALGKLGVSMV